MSLALPVFCTGNTCEYCVPLLGRRSTVAASGVTATLPAVGGVTFVVDASDVAGVRIDVAVRVIGSVWPPRPEATSYSTDTMIELPELMLTPASAVFSAASVAYVVPEY